jgi:hypothetical protein
VPGPCCPHRLSDMCHDPGLLSLGPRSSLGRIGLHLTGQFSSNADLITCEQNVVGGAGSAAKGREGRLACDLEPRPMSGLTLAENLEGG